MPSFFLLDFARLVTSNTAKATPMRTTPTTMPTSAPDAPTELSPFTSTCCTEAEVACMCKAFEFEELPSLGEEACLLLVLLWRLPSLVKALAFAWLFWFWLWWCWCWCVCSPSVFKDIPFLWPWL